MKPSLLISAVLILTFPALTHAQQITEPLVDLGLPRGSGFDGYINGLYILSISLAALLAVLKIIIAGVKYAVTDVVSAKGNAKQDITSALFGLLLIMGAVIVLELINPRLTSTAIKFQPISIPAPASATPPVQAAPSPTPAPAGGTPAPTTAITTIGTVSQVASVTTINTSAGYKAVDAFNTNCNQSRGTKTYNASTGIWTCTKPTIITYSGSGSAAGQAQREDCTKNGGTYDTGVALGFGTDSCVIK